MMNDCLVRIISEDGRLRAMAAVTTTLCNNICSKQQTDPTASVALSRLVTGTALMGALLKDGQGLALVVEGNGPLQRMMAETDDEGRVRASIKNPVCGLPPKDGRFDVVGAVGRAGFLHVTKDLGLKETYRSQVMLQTSEIGEDLAWYLTSSEQVPSTVALGVQLAPDASVHVAGGFIIQSLPPADEGSIAAIEQRLANYGSVSARLASGQGPREWLSDLLGETPFKIVGETSLEFSCRCNLNHCLKLLRTLGASEVEKLFAEQETVTVTCEYCRQTYPINQEQGQLLIEQLKSSH